MDAIRQADYMLIGASFALFMSAVAISSFRLKLIIGAQGRAGVTFLDALSLSLIGYFFNNFLPTSIGGDVAKGYYLAKRTRENTNSYTSVFVDRVIGLFTMVLMAFVALFFMQPDAIDARAKAAIYIIAGAAVVFLFFITNKSVARRFSFLLALVRPLEEKMRLLYNAVHGYKRHTSLMAKTLAISVTSQLIYYFSIAVLAGSIGARMTCMDTLLRMPIVSAMSLLPSINGLGLREGSMVVLFGPLIGKSNAFAVSILWLLILLITSLVGGAIYGLSPQFRVKIKEAK
jgi:uncharacterized protein (TIRG00374 family)